MPVFSSIQSADKKLIQIIDPMFLLLHIETPGKMIDQSKKIYVFLIRKFYILQPRKKTLFSLNLNAHTELPDSWLKIVIIQNKGGQ